MMQTSRQALQNRRPGLIHTNQGPLTISNLAIEHAACTGAIQFYATDPTGKITELGNTQRVFTSHQKRVILARDGGCIIPGCDTPAQWCEVHHVTPHAQGGKTHTDNGVELGQRSCPVFLVFSRHIGRVFLPPGRVCHEYETGAVRAGVEEGVVPFNEV